MGYNLIKNFFIFVNVAWEKLTESTEKIEKQNSDYLKSYAAFIENYEALVKEIISAQ